MRFLRTAAPKFAIAFAAILLAAAARPIPGNWNARIAVTPTGSHVIGNPAAAVKLTEFISYTCPHCAHFDREASDPLRLFYVTPGRLSIEVRHLVRDPIDLTVAMLTNCGPATKFLQNHTTFLRRQDSWMARANTAGEAQRARWSTGEGLARRRAIADDFGFYPIMQARGYDRQAVDRCLADEALARRLAVQTNEAVRGGVTGTPSFMLNGELLAGTHDWAALQPQIKARIERLP